MRILILEYLTGGGLLSQRASRSLLAEGAVMVDALTRDLLAIPDIRVSLFRDYRAAVFSAPSNPRVEEIRVKSEPQFRISWLEQLERCDAAWVIAPESEGVLEQFCREVEASDAALLTSPAQAVRLTANKEETIRCLEAEGIMTVPTRRASAAPDLDVFPAVVKPIDGVGCSGCRILRSLDHWKDWNHHEDGQRYVLQPLITGDVLSLSVLFNRGQALLLSCNRQHVREIDDRFVLDACEVNVFPEKRSGFERLARRIAEAVPGLWGYGGIDFIHNEQGSAVLEINPRLTTSYAGLHEALGINPAQWVCDLWLKGTLPDRVPLGARSVRINVEQHHDD